MKNYHIIGKNNQQAGPFPGEDLVKQGVTRDTFVWCEGMSDWQKAGEVDELCAIFAPASTATQPIQSKPQQPVAAQPGFGAQQPQSFQQRPAQPGFGAQQPQSFQQRPAQPGFGAQQPQSFQQRPAQPGFGAQQPQSFQQRPVQPGFGAQQPQSFQQRPAQPGFGANVQPSTGLPDPTAGQTKPDSWLWLAICSTVLCCLPLGIVSIIFATQVDSKWAAGDYAGAEEASKKAKMWGFISAGSGLIFGIIYLIFVFATGFFSALV